MPTMNNDQTFDKLEEDFLRWQQDLKMGHRVYEPLFNMIEEQFSSKNKVIHACRSDTADLTWLDLQRWDVFRFVGLTSYNALLSGFDDQSTAVVFCSVIPGITRQDIHDLIAQSKRVLINGGILILEVDLYSLVQNSSEMTDIAFLNYVQRKMGFSSRKMLHLQRFQSGTRGDPDKFSCVSVMSQKNDGSVGSVLTEAMHNAMNEMMTSLSSSAALVGRDPIDFDVETAMHAYDRWKTDAETSEAALVALSETALGAGDVARRLLKAESRILDLRKQTAVFFPITYPWSRLATVVLGSIAKIKARRRHKRLHKKKQNDPSASEDDSVSDLMSGEFEVVRFDNIGAHPKILVLKLDHIGDLFLSLPAIEVLKTAWPEAHFTLVCSPTNAGLARASALFDDVREYKFSAELSQDVRKVKANQYAAIQAVIDQEYDLALDLRHDPDTRPHLAFVNARIKAGFQSHGKHYTPLDISVPALPQQTGLHPNTHNVHRLLLLAHHVIDVLLPASFGRVGKSLAGAGAENLPVPAGQYVVLAPGGGTKAKKWSPESFAELARLIAATPDINIVVLGGPAEQEYSGPIAQAVPPGQLFDLIGKLPLTDMAAVVSKAVAFVGTDTGATHLAALLNIPTVSIFSGVADVNVWKPVGQQVSIVRTRVACAPCQIARMEQCVAEHVCMTAIEPKTVYDELCKRARF
jgi:ADP-heptose:LPS heptosyltransferase